MVLGCKFSIQHSISMIIFLVSRGKQSIMDTILGFDHNFFDITIRSRDKIVQLTVFCLMRPSHTTHETAKNALFSMHTTSFFTTAKIFFHSFLHGRRFLQICFRKFFAVLCVVYEGH